MDDYSEMRLLLLCRELEAALDLVEVALDVLGIRFVQKCTQDLESVARGFDDNLFAPLG